MRSELIVGVLGFGGALAVSLLLASANQSRAQEIGALTGEARGVVQSFGPALLKELKTALETGGPVAALEACNLRAPVIADEAATASGWSVGRTSEKLRNPDNAADAWEAQGLAQFAARAAAGEDLAKMERTEIVTADGHRTFRYMKAIPTVEMCATCHGAEIKPELQAKITALYPKDQATGYGPGMLRGAFTLAKRVD